MNVIAPIFTSPEGLFLQTIYHPLRLYAEQTQEIALDVYVDSEQMTLTAEQQRSPWGQQFADLGPFKLLDVTATRDEAGKVLTLAVVNRDSERAHETTIKLAEETTITEFTAYEVNGPEVGSLNSFTEQTVVAAQERILEAPGSVRTLSYTFPAHSLTVLRLQLA